MDANVQIILESFSLSDNYLSGAIWLSAWLCWAK